MEKRNATISGFILFFCLIFTLSLYSNVLAAGEYKEYPVPKACMDQVQKEGKTLHIYDWAEWYPEELYAGFEKEFGIKIIRDHYASTDEMMTKFKLNPKTPYDLVLGAGPDNIIKMAPAKLLYELNYDWLPNVSAYLMDEYKDTSFDPGNKHHVPSTFFMVTYTYNSKFIDKDDPLLNSWGLLLKGEKYKGRITMIDGNTEVIGAALKYLGYEWTSDTESELMEAKALLMEQKSIVMAYDSWPRRTLIEEEAWASQMWTGDGWLLSRDKPEMRGVVPKEGTLIGSNTEFIPIAAKSPATAHLFLNYMFRTKVNTLLSEWIGYPPVHKHVMEFVSPEMKAWPGFVLSKEYLAKCDYATPRYLTGKGQKLRLKIWQELKQ